MAITVKRAESVIEFCTDLQLRADWESAQEDLLSARSNTSGRLVDGDASDAASRVRDLETQMEDAVLLFRLRAVPRKQWQETVAAHPPRDDNDSDQSMGVNISTFFDALLGQSPDPAKGLESTIVAVTYKVSGAVEDFDPAADWQALADAMTDGQYGEFATKVFELNRQSVGRPFSAAASRVTAASEKN